MGTVPEEDPHDDAAGRLRALLQEDLDAGFAELVREYQQLVYTIALRVCGHHHPDAEDLAAEVFLRAYRALRGYSAARLGELRPRPWLVTITLNMGRNNARDRGRRPLQVTLEDFVERSPQGDVFDDVAAGLDRRRALAELTACLPDQQRDAVLLRHLCELSSAEVAEVLGCPEGTVRSHVSRGLVRLRGLLAERYPALAAGQGSGGTGTPVAQVRRQERISGHRRG
ncbi:RNA polymerase sigma factor [Sphaerisporangium corydalis]|uniref:RNA polymerase sigma factor n=1 Tax=Sphaerisporangium corydalis TaxID=1441875 RepID=A0ABV9E679_9ACTN|nr:sigma-70 family RNA polymerase sigma factor [Sphaerisporangium corydalis]